MAGTSSSYSSGSSSSTPVLLDNQYSQWGMQLSQLLSTLGQNQYNWAMNQFNNGMGITNDNIAHYMDLAGKGAGLAQTLLSRYTDTFAPLMDEYVRSAGSYNSEARQRFKAGQAESTVGQATTAARNEAERKLQSFGVNPNSGRYQDLLLSNRVADAAARAGAGTQASVNVADRGRAMTEKAVQMGQNVPGMTVNALQSAYTGVTGAENAILGMLNTGANLTQSAAPFFNAASGAIKMPPTGQIGQSQQHGRSTSTQLQPPQQGGANSGGGSRGGGGGGGGQQQPYTTMTGGGNAPRDPYAQQTPKAGSDLYPNGPGARGGGSMAKILNVPEAWQEDNARNAQGEQQGPPNYNAVEDYKASGTGDDTEHDGRDPWNPDTYAAAQSLSPWWTDQQGSGPSLDPNDPSTWQGGTTQGGITDEAQTPSFNTSAQEFAGSDYDWSQVQNPLDQQQQDFTGSTNNYYQDQSQGNYSQNYQQDFTQQQTGNYGGGQQQGGYTPGNYGGFDNASSWETYDTDPYASSGGSGGSGDYGGYAKGGTVQSRGVLPSQGGFASPGQSPSRGRATDDIPARLNAGEFVIPRDVVHDQGTGFFRKLIEKSRRTRTGMAGPPPKPKMKPALRLKPTFVSRGMSQGAPGGM